MNADTEEKLNKLIKHVLHTEFDNFIDFMCNCLFHTLYKKGKKRKRDI